MSGSRVPRAARKTWRIRKQGWKTIVEVPRWGTFEIWSQDRGGFFRHVITHIEHTGRLDYELPGIDWLRGASHRRALRRLAAHVQAWETSSPPMANSLDHRGRRGTGDRR